VDITMKLQPVWICPGCLYSSYDPKDFKCCSKSNFSAYYSKDGLKELIHKHINDSTKYINPAFSLALVEKLEALLRELERE
jgi:uncharacterized protein (DUF2225 family)